MPSLRPVGATFVVFGSFWGAWAVAAADVERALGLSHGGFGLLLSVALAGAALTNALGGSLTERHGTGPVLAAALVAWAVLLVTGALVRQPGAFGVVLVAVVTVGGLVDVVMNVAATAALAEVPGSLVRFHARFNAGAAMGAGATGVLLAHLVSWRWVWAALGLEALGLAVVCARATLPAGDAGAHAPLTGVLSFLRRERLVVVALAFALGAMVEGGVELWGVLFLRTHLSSGLAVGAVSATVAYLVATLARVLVGPAAGRRGSGRGVAVGGATAAAGIVVLATAPQAWLSGAGLVLAAGGISLCWPLLLAHASTGRPRPGPVVGSVSAVGYLGFVVGPAVVGWLTAVAGLRAGLLLLVVAGVFVALAPMVAGTPRPSAFVRPDG